MRAKKRAVAAVKLLDVCFQISHLNLHNQQVWVFPTRAEVRLLLGSTWLGRADRCICREQRTTVASLLSVKPFFGERCFRRVEAVGGGGLP